MIWRTALGLVGVVVLFLGIVFMTHRIQDTRRDIMMQQGEQEQLIAGAGRAAAVNSVLKERGSEFARIHAYVPPEAALGDVVSLLERLASEYALALSIPEVQEELPPGERLRNIRLRLQVVGDGQNALKFFHAVEHLSYLTRVTTWEFTIEEAETIGSTVGVLPALTIPGGGLPASNPVPNGASLTLDVVVAISNTPGDGNE